MAHLVVGLIAHVDAGKTTLAEALLYASGEIKKRGRVDHRDAFLDHHTLERARGITIFSKQARFTLGDLEIVLLDTPGHVDFSAETERTLAVLDYALLVVSGAEGVEAHTETLWRLLRRYDVPTIVFFTKMDRSLKRRKELMQTVKNSLSEACIDCGDGVTEDVREEVALCDDNLLDRFTAEGSLDDDDIGAAIAAGKVFPCFFGSGLTTEGVDTLLSFLSTYTVVPPRKDSFAAVVYKISRDENGERMTMMKLTGGALKVREPLTYRRDGEEYHEKVTRLKFYSGEKYICRDEAVAGDVCAVLGLSATVPGMALGEAQATFPPLLEPVLSYRLEPAPDEDAAAVLKKIAPLAEEIPELELAWYEPTREIQLRLMGAIQIEVIQSILKERFDVDAAIVDGKIRYKETIASKVVGIGHFEPLRHYAEVHLLLEPLESGSGIVYASRCHSDHLDTHWQRLILGQLKSYLPAGVLTGAPLTDVAITLVAGRAHPKHTEGGDFRAAAIRALRQGLMQAESVLLAPYYDFTLSVPADYVGRAINDIQHMGGDFSAPVADGDLMMLKGTAPVSKMRNYMTEVISYTRGKGRLTCGYGGYHPCRDQEAVVAAAGYEPLRDRDHPCDSVFCAHGGGFSVPWNEVPQYAHVDSGVTFTAAEPTLPDPKVFLANLDIDEKEIEAIMTREFGPIKRRRYGKSGHDDRRTAGDNGFIPKRDHLIVDGYNMIFNWDGLKEIAETDLALARHRLIDLLSAYKIFLRCEVVVVFDGYRFRGNPGERGEIDGVHVVYTAEGETADAYIEKIVREIGPKDNVRVATSDGLIQVAALSSGVLRISATELKEDIDTIGDQIDKLLLKLNRANGVMVNRIIDKREGDAPK